MPCQESPASFCALHWSAEWPSSNVALIITAPAENPLMVAAADKIKAKHLCPVPAGLKGHSLLQLASADHSSYLTWHSGLQMALMSAGSRISLLEVNLT